MCVARLSVVFLALAYGHYSTEYVSQEATAREKHRGMSGAVEIDRSEYPTDSRDRSVFAPREIGQSREDAR
jgi:hypothetical protein